MSEDRELAVGDDFAGFRIDEVLGRGGMGTVYRARDLRLDVDRALKVLDPRLGRDAGFRERFNRESRLAARIDEETVLPVHQAGEEGGHLFIAMRLVRGPDLNRLVATDGPLEPQRTARIVTAVAGALDAAHALGIVHRDVKPANVLVELGERGERIWLADFGISRPSRSDSPITSTGELLGTADYIAPEQIEGRPVDGRADVYALGCVICFLLTGEPPFRRETDLATLYAHTRAERPRPSLLAPGLPAAVDEVIARATAVDPRERYSSAGELAAAFDAAIRGAAPPRPGRTAITDRIHPLSRRNLVLPLALVALVAVVGAAALLFAGGGEDDGEVTGAGDVASVDLGAPPSAIAIGDNNVLAVSERGGELVAIDPARVSVARAPTEIDAPTAIAVGFNSVWVANAAGDEVLRFAPGAREDPIPIPVGDRPADIAVDQRWVWVANGDDGSVSRIDPAENEEDARVPVTGDPEAIAAGDEAAWALSPDSGTLTRLGRNAPARRSRETDLGGHPTDLALGEGALWVADRHAGAVIEVGRVSADPRREVELGGSPVAIATGTGSLWVVDSQARELVELDPATGERRRGIGVQKRPIALAVGEDAVWVANAGARTVSRVTP